MFDRQKRAFLVDHDDFGKFLGWNILNRGLDGTGHAGDVDQNIDASIKNLQSVGDQVLDLRLLYHITCDDVRLPAQRPYLSGDILQRCCIPCGEDDIGPFAGQCRGDRRAHPLGGPGDNCGLVLKSHVPSSLDSAARNPSRRSGFTVRSGGPSIDAAAAVNSVWIRAILAIWRCVRR